MGKHTYHFGSEGLSHWEKLRMKLCAAESSVPMKNRPNPSFQNLSNLFYPIQ